MSGPIQQKIDSPPRSAIQRTARFGAQHRGEMSYRQLENIARRTGLSRRLVRPCLLHLRDLKSQDIAAEILPSLIRCNRDLMPVRTS